MKKSFAVIGYGGQGAWHTRQILASDVASLAGVYDIDPAKNAAAEQNGIHAYGSLEELLADSNYATLTAVQNDELYRVPTVGHSWGNRSTEQPLVILWGMCKMYPDLYSEEELAQDIDDFYSTFFQVELTNEQIANIIG